MTTECKQFVFGFHPQKRREIRAQFDGGAITSDGGGLLLREVEKRIGILRQFAVPIFLRNVLRSIPESFQSVTRFPKLARV